MGPHTTLEARMESGEIPGHIQRYMEHFLSSWDAVGPSNHLCQRKDRLLSWCERVLFSASLSPLLA